MKLDVSKISEKEIKRITELNQLDVLLYAHAVELFERRYQSMKQTLPQDKAKLAFISTNQNKLVRDYLIHFVHFFISLFCFVSYSHNSS